MPPAPDVPEIKVDDPVQDFDQLFAAHYAPLTRLVYRVLGDTGRAEEVAATAFWKLHSKPPASPQNVAGWLYRTALHLALDHLKQRKRRIHYEGQASMPGATEDPEAYVERRRRADAVRQVLAALKPEQSALLVLRSEGYRLAEIAELLALNPSSVGTMLARADEAFRKEYVKRYGQQ